MGQIQRRLTSEQVRFVLQGYLEGNMSRAAVQDALKVGKTRFFALLKEYRRDPEASEVFYSRRSPGRLTPAVEAEIRRELLREKKLVEDPRRPKKKVHDREVLTTSIGALIQHDASLHLGSPYAQEKWTLITSIDDFSRKLLFADFFPVEATPGPRARDPSSLLNFQRVHFSTFDNICSPAMLSFPPQGLRRGEHASWVSW